MKLRSRWFVLLVLLVLLPMLFLGAWFASENDTSITPMVFGYSLPQASSGTYLLLTLFCGLTIGYISGLMASGFKLLSLKRELRKKDQDLKKLSSTTSVDR